MKLKLRWDEENPVVFYDGKERIEMKQHEIREVNMKPVGAGFTVISEDYISEQDNKKSKLELEQHLLSNGLSALRRQKVVNRYLSIEEVKLDLPNLPFEEMTNKFLIDLFSEEKKKKEESKPVKKTVKKEVK